MLKLCAVLLCVLVAVRAEDAFDVAEDEHASDFEDMGVMQEDAFDLEEMAHDVNGIDSEDSFADSADELLFDSVDAHSEEEESFDDSVDVHSEEEESFDDSVDEVEQILDNAEVSAEDEQTFDSVAASSEDETFDSAAVAASADDDDDDNDSDDDDDDDDDDDNDSDIQDSEAGAGGRVERGRGRRPGQLGVNENRGSYGRRVGYRQRKMKRRSRGRKGRNGRDGRDGRKSKYSNTNTASPAVNGSDVVVEDDLEIRRGGDRRPSRHSRRYPCRGDRCQVTGSYPSRRRGARWTRASTQYPGEPVATAFPESAGDSTPASWWSWWSN